MSSATSSDVSPLRASGILDVDGKMIMEREVMTSTLLRLLQRKGERFLRGPVPLEQLATAARLPGSALAVLLLIHHQTVVTQLATVRLSAGLLREFGIDRAGKARAIRALEGVGLVRVTRASGRTALVSLRRETQPVR
jgi:hypothetical protein